MSAVRVLFISHDGGLAGAQRVLLSTVLGLDRALFEAHLVVPGDGELQEMASAGGIDVVRRVLCHWAPCVANLHGARRLEALSSFFSGFRDRVWGLAGLIERLRIDLVYTNTAIVLEGAVAAWRTRRPHVWHVHEPIFGNPELLPLFPNWLYMASIGRLSDQVIVPSHALQRSYHSLSTKTTVVYNGIKIPLGVDRLAASRQLRARVGLSDQSTLIGTVGAIQPRKDYATFISAARRVHDNLPDVRFVVVGNGAPEYVRRLEAEIDAAGMRGIFIRIPRWEGDITDFFAAVDIAVIASIQESFGLTAAEALAVGTPLVTTRCGGPEEVIGSENQSCLVNVGDAGKLADAISALCYDAGLRRRLGLAGQERVLTNFSQQAYLRGVSEVIQGHVGGRSQSRY